MRSHIIGALTVMVAMAGCLNDQEPVSFNEATVAGEDVQVGEGRIFAGAAPILNHTDAFTTDDWFYAAATAGPGAHLTAFNWTVPEGAISEHDRYDWEAVVLEMAAHSEGLSELMIWVFDTSGEHAELIGLRIDTAMDAYEETAFVLSSEGQYEPDFEPYYLFIDADELKEGDELTFVVAARADEEGTLDLAWRTHDAFPDDAPAEEVSDLMEDLLDMGAGHIVDAAYVGQGAAFDFYLEINVGLLVPSQFIITAGNVTVESDPFMGLDLRPVGAVRTATMSTDFDAEEGTTIAVGAFLISDGAMTWEVDAELHDMELEEDGTHVAAGTWVGEAPFFYGLASGDGGASTEMIVEVANVNDVELAIVQQVSLGVSIESITGKEWQDEGYVSNGCLLCQQVELPGTVGWIGDGPSVFLPAALFE